MFSSSDDNAMIKQIEATNAPDDRDFTVKPLLEIVEDIFHRSTPAAPGVALEMKSLEAVDEKALHSGFDDMFEFVSRTIYRIYCELGSKCFSAADAHTTTIAILNILSNYKWDAKVVLSLAGFALIYGEFWLDAQLYQTNPLAKGVAILKHLPTILERSDTLKPRLEAVTKLIRAMLDVSRCIVEFKQLPSQYVAQDSPELSTATAHIPIAVYWTIRSTIASAAQIIGLIGMGYEFIASTQETWELLSLAHKLSSIHDHLNDQLKICHQLIEERKHIEAYQTLVRLFKTAHIDNMKILRALFYAKDGLPLYNCSSGKKVSIDVLKKKLVLLFISDLELSVDELQILLLMYNESKQNMRPESEYEVVWVPVVDRSVAWNEERQKHFEYLQSMMPWYMVNHPSIIDPAVIRYIKEEWLFNKKPLLVVLDPQGREVNRNAIHMMWIWGGLAYPFTRAREEAIWKQQSWSLELLADNIEPLIFTWMKDGKYICLYGGEDIEWIRKFTVTAQAVAEAAKIGLEMLYVGKSNPRERVRKNNAIIQVETLSHTLPDLTLIWYFWVRLESMWHSKTQQDKQVDDDPIMQEVMTMLSFDGSDIGWAVIFKGSNEMARAKGDTFLKCLNEYTLWKDRVGPNGFVPAMNEHLDAIHSPHHCNRLILPGTTRHIPERVVCSECRRPMEKFLMYRCCTD